MIPVVTPEEGAPPVAEVVMVGRYSGPWGFGLLGRDAHGRIWEYRDCVVADVLGPEWEEVVGELHLQLRESDEDH
jgi:hypothetical protein